MGLVVIRPTIDTYETHGINGPIAVGALGLVVAYGRVSSQQQANLGALERQEKSLLDGANADRVILDVGSGTKTGRKGYQELLELIGSGLVDKVLVADQDRLNRNLQADLALLDLCRDNDTSIFDLHGRELEFRTPDGELLVSVIGALNQHRSRHYGAKVRRSLQAAREMGRACSSRVPFGFRRVRDQATGKAVTFEINPAEEKQARERIQWFLEGKSLVQMIALLGEKHGLNASTRSISNWLRHPSLTGRLCWKVDRQGNFEQVQEQPSFKGLIDDATHELIVSKLGNGSLHRAIRDRKRRIFSGVWHCADCGNRLAYKLQSKARDNGVVYLRCGNQRCRRRGKYIRHDQVLAVLQFAVHQHALSLIPLLDRPAVDPAQVGVLQAEIKMLSAVSGTEELIRQKQDQINKLRLQTADTPQWLMVATLQSQQFWLQSDESLNDILHLIIDRAEITLADHLDDAMVTSIRFKTTPAEGPLPADQHNVLIPVTLRQFCATVSQQERIDAALAALTPGG